MEQGRIFLFLAAICSVCLLNDVITPALGIECFVCSSFSWDNCLNPRTENKLPIEDCSPNVNSCLTELSVVERRFCSDYNDECFSLPGREFVVRGCLDNILLETAPHQIPPMDLDNEKYRTCSTSLCNNEEIFKEYCIRCESGDDVNCNIDTNSTTKVECPLSLVPMGCYHKVDKDDVVVSKGCVSSLNPEEAELCAGEVNPCVIIIGNNEKIKTEESDPVTVEVNTIPAIEDQTDKNDTTIPLITSPAIVEDSIQGEKGNNVSISTVEYLNCIRCDSEIDAECGTLFNSHKWETECNTSDRNGCFTATNKNSITRGCLGDLIDVMYEECLVDCWCKICKENNCNNLPYESNSGISLSSKVFLLSFSIPISVAQMVRAF